MPLSFETLFTIDSMWAGRTDGEVAIYQSPNCLSPITGYTRFVTERPDPNGLNATYIARVENLPDDFRPGCIKLLFTDDDGGFRSDPLDLAPQIAEARYWRDYPYLCLTGVAGMGSCAVSGTLKYKVAGVEYLSAGEVLTITDDVGTLELVMKTDGRGQFVAKLNPGEKIFSRTRNGIEKAEQLVVPSDDEADLDDLGTWD